VVCIQVLLTILALIDVAAGSALIFNLTIVSAYVGYAILVKGGWTILSTFTNDITFTLIGVLDCIAGLLLLLSPQGVLFSWLIGIIVLLKGIWSFVSSV